MPSNDNTEIIERLHVYARECVEELREAECELDKKQLRYNDIVHTSLRFYPSNPRKGVRELVASTNKGDETLYVKGRSMAQTLEEDYTWMLMRWGDGREAVN